MEMNRQILADLRVGGTYQFQSCISASQYLVPYRLIDSFVSAPATALDWGAGSGHFSYDLLANGFQVTSFTIEAECQLAPMMKEKFPDRYSLVIAQSAVVEIPLASASFDFIVSIGVLEHVRETGGTEIASLAEIYRLLKPGGRFICCHFPNRYSWIESITKHLSHKHNHPYLFSRRDIRDLMSSAGFELLATGRYNILPRLMFRRLPRVIGDSPCAVAVFNALDRGVGTLFNLFCQNHYFVAQKPE